MKFKSLKEKLLQNAAFREEYYSRDLAFAVSVMIAEARIRKGLTQENLAKLMDTEQPSIARIENGSSLPSLRFLQKMADALDSRLIPPKFEFMEANHNMYFNFNFDTGTEKADKTLFPSVETPSSSATVRI